MNPDEKGRAMIGQMFDDAGWKVVSLSRDEVVFSPLLLPIKSIKPLGHYAFFLSFIYPDITRCFAYLSERSLRLRLSCLLIVCRS